MAPFPTAEQLSKATSDVELNYQMRGLQAVVRVANSSSSAGVDFVFEGAGLSQVRPAQGGATVTLAADDNYWKMALQGGTPKPGYESLSGAMQKGLQPQGDFLGTIAPYQLGLQRLFTVFVDLATGAPPKRHDFTEIYRDTDTAVGRYVWVKANGTEARIYYEEAGTGDVPLLLQATAGADSRQYRYLLADPEMQKRFRMIAYDLPYHGRSMPPTGDRWWESAYKPSCAYLMNWILSLSTTLKLQQPWFMGCSVGGQLALDLAAEHPAHFGAFISLNGRYDPAPMPGFSNDMFRTPSISYNLFPALMLGATGPLAPERNAHEVQWIYATNYAGIYAGDNEYFMFDHDLKINGHKIDGQANPVYLLAGEYDATAYDEEHGAPAVARHCSGVQTEIMPTLSHFAMSDDPVAFSQALLPILDRIREQASKSSNN